MNAKPTKAGSLHDRYGRACAKLARKATADTIYGGARALVFADRLESMGSKIPGHEIVSEVYSRSTGKTSETWGAWECGECGCAYLGRDAAEECCAECWEDCEEGCECQHEPAPRVVPALGHSLPTCHKCGVVYLPDDE